MSIFFFVSKMRVFHGESGFLWDLNLRFGTGRVWRPFGRPPRGLKMTTKETKIEAVMRLQQTSDRGEWTVDDICSIVGASRRTVFRARARLRGAADRDRLAEVLQRTGSLGIRVLQLEAQVADLRGDPATAQRVQAVLSLMDERQ